MAQLKINDKTFEVAYKMLPMSSIQPSHNPLEGFSKNPNYSYENERLYHAEKFSQDRVFKTASHLDASLLLDSLTPEYGAPVIDAAGQVLGGNSRAMALIIASAKFPEKFQSYQMLVKNFCAARRIAYIPDGILCREIQGAIPEDIISILNFVATSAKTQRCEYRSKGLKISAASLKILAESIGDNSLKKFFGLSESKAFLDSLLDDQVILDTEYNVYLQGGYLSATGREMIIKALYSRIAANYDIIARLPQPIIDKLESLLTVIIRINALPDFSIEKELTDVLTLIDIYKSGKFQNIKHFLSSIEILSGKTYAELYSELACVFFSAFMDDSKTELYKKFKEFLAQAETSATPMAAMLGLNVTRIEAINKSFNVNIKENIIENQEVEFDKYANINPDVNFIPTVNPIREEKKVEKSVYERVAYTLKNSFNFEPTFYKRTSNFYSVCDKHGCFTPFTVEIDFQADKASIKKSNSFNPDWRINNITKKADVEISDLLIVSNGAFVSIKDAKTEKTEKAYIAYENPFIDNDESIENVTSDKENNSNIEPEKKTTRKEKTKINFNARNSTCLMSSPLDALDEIMANIRYMMGNDVSFSEISKTQIGIYRDNGLRLLEDMRIVKIGIRYQLRRLNVA